MDLTQEQVDERIAGLDDGMARAVVCALVGHSRVQDQCFGYYSCCRCGAQLGDTLGGVYSAAERAVVLNHNCDTCRANAQSLTWKDTFRLSVEAASYVESLIVCVAHAKDGGH